MANPFDEFDGQQTASASSGDNPFDEFDDKPKKGKQEGPTFMDKAKGLGEAALSVGTGLAGMSLQGIAALAQAPFSGIDEALKNTKPLAEALQYEPRTEEGKKQAKVVNDTMHDYQQEVEDKFAGDVVQLNKNKEARGEQLTPGDLQAENTERLFGQIIGGTYVPGIRVPNKADLEVAPGTAARDLGKPGERVEPTLNPETPPGQMPPTGPQGPAPKLMPDQVQGDLFQRGYTPAQPMPRTQPDMFGGPDITFPDDAHPAIRPELRWMQERSLDESRQAMEQAFAKSHDDFVVNQVKQAELKDQANERMAAEQAEVQRRTAELQNQDLADRLERADNETSANEIRRAMQANEDLIAKLNAAEAARGQNPIYVDPQAQAFRGEPGAPDPRLGLDRQTSAMDTELTHLRGQGTPEGTPLRPLTDVTREPTQPLEAYTPNASRDYEIATGVKPESPPKGMVAVKPAEPTPATPTGRSLGSTVKGKGQRGGITTDLLTLGMLPKKNPIRTIMKTQKDGSFIPNDLSPEELGKGIEKARTEPDGKGLKYMESGAQLASMKRGSSAIRMAGDLVEGAFKRAELAIRKIVFPAEDAIRQLSTRDMMYLGDVLKTEMFEGERYSKQQLSRLSPEQQNAYRIMRDSLDQSLKAQNEARAIQGKKPVTPKEAYLSSRWNGDFRRPLYDKDGKVAWFLAAETRRGLDAQTRAVLKDHPDLAFEPKDDIVIRFWNRKTDMESAYTTMLDILGRDDNAVAALQQYMEDTTKGRAASFLNQEKHFKQKGNSRGFVGDRPQTTLNDYADRSIPFGDKIKISNRPKAEMLDMFQQQMQYMKNALRWSEMQKSAESLKKIVNDPDLVRDQPNNVKYIREYYKHALGYGESRFTRAMADSLRDFGVSPEPFDRAVGGMKSFFILDKLAASIGYITTQGIQLSMIIPHMVDLAVKGRFVSNPIKAIASGLLGGLTMGTGHMFNAHVKGARFDGIPGADFFNRAYKYAEDNGITARSIYDESPVHSSFTLKGQIGKGLGKTISVPETFIRSMAFTTLAQFLKDSGKFSNELDIFREAERRTNVAMVDYAKTERPMIFGKLGSAGNFLNTLQTFGWNYYNQFSYFTRQAAQGNVMPMAAFLAMQYAVGGAMGIPGIEDAYKAYMAIKDKLPATYWQKIQENPFLREPKLWMVKNFGTSSAYGALSDKLNVNMTSRLAAPSANQMLSSPIGPPVEIAKQAYSAGRALLDPTNTTKLSQAAMDLTPPGVQGIVENLPIMEGHTYNKRPDGTREVMRPTQLENRSGLIIRNDRDTLIRRFGLRSQNEVTQRDTNYAVKRDEVAAQANSKDLVDKFYDAARRGDKKDASDFYKTYAYITGKKITMEQLQSQVDNEFKTDQERAVGNAKQNLQALLAIKRVKEIHDAVAKENQK